MRQTDFEDAIFNWADRFLNASRSVPIPVIWERQNAPKPHMDYVSLSVIGSRRPGLSWASPSIVKESITPDSPDGAQVVRWDEARVVNLKGHGTTGVDLVESLLTSLLLVTVRDVLTAAGLSVQTVGVLNPLPQLVDGQYESTCEADVTFGSSGVTTDIPGWINTVDLSSTIAPPQ
jgi:hypothetical protein